MGKGLDYNFPKEDIQSKWLLGAWKDAHQEMPTRTLPWVTVMPCASVLCGCCQQVASAEACDRDLGDTVVSLGLRNLNCSLSVLDKSLPTLLRPLPPPRLPAPATLTSSLCPQHASLRASLQPCPLPGVPFLSSSHFLSLGHGQCWDGYSILPRLSWNMLLPVCCQPVRRCGPVSSRARGLGLCDPGCVLTGLSCSARVC